VNGSFHRQQKLTVKKKHFKPTGMESFNVIAVRAEHVKEGQVALRAGLQSLAHAHKQEQHAFIQTTISEHAEARRLFRDLRVFVSELQR